MAVGHLINLFESIDPQTPSMQESPSEHTSTSRLRLSLRTMFHSSLHRNQSPPSTASTSAPTSSSSSPSSSYRSYSRPFYGPTTDLNALLTPTSSPPSTISSARGRRLRRQPSTIDLALEAERCAIGIENLGLGLLEPRPAAYTPVHATSLGPGFGHDRAPSVVLDNIFEVMEGH